MIDDVVASVQVTSKAHISFTAFLVARSLVGLHYSHRWKALIDKQSLEFYRICVHVCTRQDAKLKLFDRLMPHSLALVIVDMLFKGLPIHYWLRKQWIEQQVRRAIHDGITQVVNMGAGFDMLCTKLSAEFPQVRFIEIDHPYTQVAKQNAVRDYHKKEMGNCHFLSCDLSECSLHDALSDYSLFNPSMNTIFIAEGLTMYLTQEENDRVFETIKKLPAPHNKIIFTVLERLNTNKSWLEKFLNTVLKKTNEKHKFSMAQEDMQTYLRSLQFMLQQTAIYTDLQKDIRREKELMALRQETGEHIYLAQKNAT